VPEEIPVRADSRRVFAVLVVLATLHLSSPRAHAEEVAIDPSMSQAEVDSVVHALVAGDVLTVALGDYPGRELDLRTTGGAGLVGTQASPITIRGERGPSGERPHLIADTDAFQEAVRIRTGCAFIVLEGLHLSAVGADVQAGIYFDDGVHDITIRDSEISDVTGIGIQIQTRDDVHHVVVVDTEIHHTGTNTSSGSNGGQAFTAGGFTSDGATTGVHHLVLRHNLVHDTRGQEGDCAKFMYGVYASVMEDNVFYDCPRGVAQDENYGITSYGSGVGHFTDAADDNVLRRNLLFRTEGTGANETNVAIYAGPGTVVENNLVVDADIGIAARLEDEANVMRNLRVVNNTVYGTSDHAFSIRGCAGADASVVVANNVFAAVRPGAFGYRMPDPLGAMRAEQNHVQGEDYGEASAPVVIAISAPLDALFASPGSIGADTDFMPLPGSALVDTGASMLAASDDFDVTARPSGAGPDVGAYELRADLASHAAIGPAFKGTSGTDIDYSPRGGSSGCGCAVGGAGEMPGAHATLVALAAVVIVVARMRRRPI